MSARMLSESVRALRFHLEDDRTLDEVTRLLERDGGVPREALRYEIYD